MSRIFHGGWLLIGIALAVTTIVYWAGLRGGYIYDDFSFLLGNQSVKVTTTRLGDWVAAMLSFPSGAQQGRWLGMLSFAINHYFTAMDPFGFKLTNLVIHLLNGTLLFLALRALFALYHESASTGDRRVEFDGALAAAAIAALWLVLPINLTAVLYISQRLEALSNTFVFLGLWWYLEARRTHLATGKRTFELWASLVLCTTVGVAVKESAVLLPLYTACAELVLTRGLRGKARDRSIYWLYGSLLVIPLAIGVFWLASWVDGTRSFGRSFDVPSRLMTEARVLVDYMRWTLLPSLDSLTLYHDDIQPSRGLLTPPSTLASLVALALIAAAAIWQRRSRPLFALGVFWFFAGHSLTATVIPLLLAFEHRNYFPSAGLLLAIAALVALEGSHLRSRALALASMCVFAFYAGTTALRAQEWSEPDRLVMSEATKRPESANAQYELGRLMIMKLRRPDGTPMTEDGYMVLENAMKLPGAGTTFEQSLITFHAEHRQPIDPAWWQSLIAKLKARPPSVSDGRVLANLNHCFIDNFCGTDITPLKDAYEAALSHGASPPQILSVHAEFAWYLLHDRETAEKDIREATRLVPLDVAARRNLFVLLLATGQIEEARAELAELRRINRFGMLNALINPLQAALLAKENGSEAKAHE